eukprot:365898-Chlamydomonas_euryale.AAC.11
MQSPFNWCPMPCSCICPTTMHPFLLQDYKSTQKAAAEKEAASLPLPSPPPRAAAPASSRQQVPDVEQGTPEDTAAAERQVWNSTVGEDEALHGESLIYFLFSMHGACMQMFCTSAEREHGNLHALLQAQKARTEAALANSVAFNEQLIEERDAGIEEIAHQVCKRLSCACATVVRWRTKMGSVCCGHGPWPGLSAVNMYGAEHACLAHEFVIGEVNEMFQDLAVLINDQGVQVGGGALAALNDAECEKLRAYSTRNALLHDISSSWIPTTRRSTLLMSTSAALPSESRRARESWSKPSGMGVQLATAACASGWSQPQLSRSSSSFFQHNMLGCLAYLL